MTDERRPSFPEPPAVGDEAATLAGSLERQRATFAWKCADLSSEGLRRRLGPSELTLGRLLKHLAYMEDLNFTTGMAGLPLPSPWSEHDAADRSDWALGSADSDSAETLYALWTEAVGRSRMVLGRALADDGPDLVFRNAGGHEESLRRLLVDMIEEYGRHTGHADLLREAIDGRVGEDPPGTPYAFRLG